MYHARGLCESNLCETVVLMQYVRGLSESDMGCEVCARILSDVLWIPQ